MARLDTGWCVHPKVLALSVAGMAVHAWSISYCDLARSDGLIPDGSWPSKKGFAEGIKEVIKAGLWEPCEGGFLLHDYLKYNRTKEQIEKELALTAERQRRFRNGVTNASDNELVTSSRAIRAHAPGPGPGPEGSGDLLKNGSTPVAGAGVGDGADGAPPRASPPRAENSDDVKFDASPPPRWEEIAPGQHLGTPNGQGEVTLLKVRCSRCERAMLIAEVEDHDCQLVPGEPIHAPPKRRGGRGFRRPFAPSGADAEAPPAEVQEQLDRMEAEARRTPEQVAAVLARLGHA